MRMLVLLTCVLDLTCVGCGYTGAISVLNIDATGNVRSSASARESLRMIGSLPAGGGPIVAAQCTPSHLFVLRRDRELERYDHNSFTNAYSLGNGYFGLVIDSGGNVFGIRLSKDAIEVQQLDDGHDGSRIPPEVCRLSHEASGAIGELPGEDICICASDDRGRFAITTRLNSTFARNPWKTIILDNSNGIAEVKCTVPVAGAALLSRDILLGSGERSLEGWDIKSRPTLKRTYAAESVVSISHDSHAFLVQLRPSFSTNLMTAEAPLGVVDSDDRLWGTSISAYYNSVTCFWLSSGREPHPARAKDLGSSASVHSP